MTDASAPQRQPDVTDLSPLPPPPTPAVAQAIESAPLPIPEPPPAQSLPACRLLVHFVHEPKKGKQRHERIWINDLPAIPTLEKLLQVEAAIAEHRKLTGVQILGWRALHG